MVLTSFLRTIGTLGFTDKGSGSILCSAQCSDLATFSLFTRRLEILRRARERELEKDLSLAGCRTVSNNGSGSGLVPAQNILAVQVWFGFT